MSVLTAWKKVTEPKQVQVQVSPELKRVVDDSLYALIQRVFEESAKVTPIPCNREIAETLRVNVGDEAVRVWEEFIDDLGF